MNLDSMSEIIAASVSENKPIWELVIEADMENRAVTRENTIEKMAKAWQTMLDASRNYDPQRRSMSGLVGGQGEQMRAYAAGGNTIGGNFTAEVMAEALAMGESNACMCRIVAAPTAGACGVMPAVLIPFYRREKISDERMVEAMLVASGIGAVLAFRASISGAAGGCQAEIGSASAMAAGALVTLRGGTAEQVGHAVAMALKNLMGLVCDPVAGLVEVPCVKRNVIGAMNAIAAADMALAGIESRIPVDEVIDAMGDVGRRLPVEFRETALGGLAATPTGKAVKDTLLSNKKKTMTLVIKDAKFKLKKNS